MTVESLRMCQQELMRLEIKMRTLESELSHIEAGLDAVKKAHEAHADKINRIWSLALQIRAVVIALAFILIAVKMGVVEALKMLL